MVAVDLQSDLEELTEKNTHLIHYNLFMIDMSEHSRLNLSN
jgi:hypothetical protein